MLFFFFFKQKTAYDMRISDWSFRRVLFRSVVMFARPPSDMSMPQAGEPPPRMPYRQRGHIIGDAEAQRQRIADKTPNQPNCDAQRRHLCPPRPGIAVPSTHDLYPPPPRAPANLGNDAHYPRHRPPPLRPTAQPN